MLKIRKTATPNGPDKPTVSIVWTSKVISKKVAFRVTSMYCKCSYASYKAFVSFDTTDDNTLAAISQEQLTMIRNHCLIQSLGTNKRSARFRMKDKRFMAACRMAYSGGNVKKLSGLLRLSPTAAVKEFMIADGGVNREKCAKKSAIVEMNGGKVQVIDNSAPCTRYDIDQYRKALIASEKECHIDSAKYNAISAAVAETNEQIFVNWFRGNVTDAIRTQEELVEEQTLKYGRAVNTPDILLVTPIIINSATVNWIEFKNYVGTSTPPMYQSVKSQVERYVEAFGPGAIVYAHSFVDSINFGPDVQILESPKLDYMSLLGN